MSKETIEKTPVTKEMVTAALVEPNEELKIERLIYCGPSIAKAGLQQFTVFKNGIPEYAKDLDCKSVKEVFKPISELAAFRKKVSLKGSAENQHYQNILYYIKEG